MRVWQTLVLSAMTIGLISACSEPKQNLVVTYDCGAQLVTADFSNQLTLQINEQQFQFEQEPTASGSRYFSRDHEAEFWTKGDEAQLAIGADIYPLCVQSGRLPQQFSARGNEPFWLLQRKDAKAALRRPSGDRDFIDIQSDSNESGWQLALDDSTTLVVQHQLCHDTMTGMPYPYQAQLKLAGESMTGCAGEPRRLFVGTSWQLVGSNLATAPTITFMNDQRVYGFAGCNRFQGSYQLTGEGLRLGRMAATKMMCSPEQMLVEDAFLQALENSRQFDIEADQFILISQQQQLRFIKNTAN